MDGEGRVAAGAIGVVVLVAVVLLVPGKPPVDSPGIEDSRGSLEWTVDLGAEAWATPAAVGSTVYVGANDGIMRAIDIDSGEVLWEYPSGGEIRSQALAASGNLYFTSDNGLLHAVRSDGSELWRTEIGGVIERTTWDTFGSRPVIADGLVVVGSGDGFVYAVSESDGTPVWAFDTGGPVRTSIATGEGLVFAESNSGRAFALDLLAGTKVWEFNLTQPGTTSPLYADGVVVVGSRNNLVVGLDARTGAELWTQSYGKSWVQSGGVAYGDMVVLGSSDIGEVRAFDLHSGTLEWATTIGGWAWGIPVIDDGVLYTSSLRPENLKPWNYSVHAIDPADGRILWQAGTGPTAGTGAGTSLTWAPFGHTVYGVAGSPALAPTTVIVAGLDGVVYAFER